jgi:NAD-dependent deacetylase
MNKTKTKKIVFFTGAGVSAESGIPTFRSGTNALWNGVKVEVVATPEGWRADKELVLNFYNERRAQLSEVGPNAAHKAIAEAEEDFQKVTVITQNIDNMHERAGSTNILHLHGELLKSRSTVNPNLIYDQFGDIKLGDKCEKGFQLRPHVVWFGEFPLCIPKAEKALQNAHYIVVVGTSLQIGYTIPMLANACDDNTVLYYIDPNPVSYLDKYGIQVKYIKETASRGVPLVLEEIKKSLNEK